MAQNKLKTACEILDAYDSLELLDGFLDIMDNPLYIDNPIDIENAIIQLEDYMDDYGDETCSYDVDHLNLIADVIDVLKGA